MRMDVKSQVKVALGIIFTIISLPVMGFSFFFSPRVTIMLGIFMVGLILLIAGILFLVLGIRKRPEVREFPNEVVINGIHYPKSAFVNVDRCVKGRETVFAMRELQMITGISAEEARKVVNNWRQYY